MPCAFRTPLLALALLARGAAAGACAQEGATCSFWQSCCGGMQCQMHNGLLDWRCKQNDVSVCVAEGQTCGGPGLDVQRCCDGMTCERHFMGTDNLQCVKPRGQDDQCKAAGEVCGCAGCRTMPCCGGQTCSEVNGQGGQLYCVDTGRGELLASGTTLAAGNASEVSASAGLGDSSTATLFP